MSRWMVVVAAMSCARGGEAQLRRRLARQQLRQGETEAKEPPDLLELECDDELRCEGEGEASWEAGCEVECEAGCEAGGEAGGV